MTNIEKQKPFPDGYNARKEKGWFPQDYSPELTVSDWTELLRDTSVFTLHSLQIVKRMKDYGGQATCKQLSVKYGESPNFYNGGSSGLARRVAEKTGCPTMVTDTEEQRWSPILYTGKRAESDVKAARIRWNLTGAHEETMTRFLTVMQTDITLRLGEKILIIDAKYYGRTLQRQYDKSSLHSGNIYQIFTYVKNQDSANTGNVAGLLLYAKTEEAVTPDCSFNMGGNQISAKTLDLNQDFRRIASQLDKIAEEYFGKRPLHFVQL